MKKKAAFVILLVVAAYTGLAAEKFDPALGAKLQKALADSIAGSGTIGVSAAVMMPDGALWAGAAGISHQGAPVTTAMLFDIASIQKNLQAALALLMAENGVLALDDPLDKWLPPYARIDGRITVRQLLGMTSGIADFVKAPASPWRVNFGEIDFAKKWTWDEIHVRLVGEPDFKPGERCAYSSTNYILLRLVQEKAAGAGLPGEMRRSILKPFRLDHTRVDLLHSLPRGTAVAHGWYDDDGDGKPSDLSGRSREWLATIAPLLTYSTPSDLVRWMNALYHEKKVLGRDMLKQMLAFRGPVDGEPLMKGYGLGVAELDPAMFNPALEGLRMFGHLGSNIGYMACAGYFPDHGISLALASNRGGDREAQGAIVAVFNALMEALAEKLK